MAVEKPDLTPSEMLDVALFSEYLNAMSDEDLLHAEKLILELVEHPGWLLVQDILGKTLEASTARMRHANPKDPATMWRDIGTQAGIDSARQVTRAIVHKARRRQEKIAEKQSRRERTAVSSEA
jgi:hypothetical protein